MDPILDLTLNAAQTKWLLNLENILVEHDILNESNTKDAIRKKEWLLTWKTNAFNAYDSTFANTGEELSTFFCPMSQLLQDGDHLYAEKPNNTWYYIVVLEAHLFRAYIPLEASDDKKRWKGLSYSSADYLKTVLDLHGKIPGSYVSRIQKAYKKALSRLQGRGATIGIALLATATITALTFGAAALLAPKIAVILVGRQFVTHGMALTLQSLAYFGGGAIATGGAGVAGGTLLISGGGALLAFSVAGPASMATASLILASPQATLLSAAKLEVTFKEILLNAKGNIEAASLILTQHKEQITKLQHLLVDLEGGSTEANRQQISNLKKTIAYLSRSYKELVRFFSSYQEGSASGTSPETSPTEPHQRDTVSFETTPEDTKG